MATVTTPHQTFNRVDADRRVRHPLSTVRGYIRRYVLLEGIALTVLYLALVFWIGLFIDYWPWKLFSFDWLWTADELSGSGGTVLLRSVVLVAVLAGLVALIVFKVARRLFKEFSDSAVALLLEKRYPKQLGDRLITAVELADPALAAKWRNVMQAAYDEHRAAQRRKEETFFTDHAGENETEFFADATETFYCCPVDLLDDYPDVYMLLAGYFRVDPVKWFPDRV